MVVGWLLFVACCCFVFSLFVGCLLVVVRCLLLVPCCLLIVGCCMLLMLAFVVLFVVGRGSSFVDRCWLLVVVVVLVFVVGGSVFDVRCLLRVAFSWFVMFV